MKVSLKHVVTHGPVHRMASTPETPPPQASATPSDEVSLGAEKSFPKQWIGNWHGELHVHGRNGTTKMPMSLNIQPKGPDSYTWHIKYGDQPTRPYELVERDGATGHWAVDEKNGIVIESFEAGDVFTSQFEVNRVRVTSRYELKDGRLHMEMQTFGRQPMTRTGTGQFEVDSFEHYGMQRAELERD